jgi:FtsP/CotA-like multicopper oxidase with cupredoxin domain
VLVLAGTATLSSSVFAAAGWGDNFDRTGAAIKVPTYYANSPNGLRSAASCFDANGAPATPVLAAACDSGTPLRKFVDSLPLLPGSALATVNQKGVTAGKSLGVAVKESGVSATYADADYYELAVVEFRQQMHSDLPTRGSTLRGYVQIWTPNLPAGTPKTPLYYVNQNDDPTWVETAHPVLDNLGRPVFTVGKPQYLGPTILSTAKRAVRVKFNNYLPTGRYDPVTKTRGGDVFIPTDETVPGSGFGPDGITKYTQNRTNIHLHGGDSPWISDGGPHTWITPAGENTPYPRGVGARNVPDMPDPGPGATTYFWPNNQSARQMWYHDHSFGSTRIDVTAGIVSGFFITDAAEQNMIAKGVLPAEFIPLVYEDKTFVPKDVGTQDAKWDTSAWGQYGDIWMPHVYETNQDPNSLDGTNPVGRWDYGPWFWPVFPAPLALPSGNYGDASGVQEAFADTSVVNGVAYPDLAIDPKTYRFRLLNASTSRYLNVGLYIAEPLSIGVKNGGSGYTSAPKVTISDPQASAVAVIDPASGSVVAINLTLVPGAAFTTLPTVSIAAPGVGGVPAELIASINTEVPMLPAVPELQPDAAAVWHRDTFDGRAGGIPVYAQRGPDINMIGNEGGFLPKVVPIESKAVSYEQNRRSVTVLNVLEHGLYMGPAERADLVIDFSKYAGKTIVMYNDAPAPNPGFDPRVDYWTGDGDNTGVGGADNTLPGYGPNTRTVMRFTVSNAAPAAALDVAALSTAVTAAYGATQDKPIVPQALYNDVWAGASYTDNLAKIYVGSAQQPTMPVNTSLTAAELAAGKSLQVTGFITESQGYDYTVAPDVIFSGGGLPDGSPLHAKAHAVLDQLGKKVLQVVIDAPGSYVSAPTVTLRKSATSGLKDNGIGAAVIPLMSNTDLRPVQNKGIQELFDPNYGRMNATFSVELPFTSVLTQTTIPVAYIDPATEFISDGETQIWKVTHNGVDAHPVHFHLFNVQVVNRVGWDGTIKPIDPSEQGWKETVKMNPLEDIYIAVKPKTPKMPFGIPNSVRALDPSQPIGATSGFTGVDPFTGLASVVSNTLSNYGWEYVWHCHILGHEENDFMRPMIFDFKTAAPLAVPGRVNVRGSQLSWTDPTPVTGTAIATDGVATLGHKANEIGFIVQRNDGQGWLPKVPATPPSGTDMQTNMLPSEALALQKATTLANVTTWTDSVAPNQGTQYRVVGFNSAGYSIAMEPGTLAATMTVATDPTAAASNAVTISSFGLAVGTVTPIVDTAANPGAFSIPLTWRATGTPAGFTITRTGGIDATGVALPASTFPIVVTPGAPVPTTFTDTTATQASNFQYSIVGVDANGRPGTATAFTVQTDYATPPVVPAATAALAGTAIVVNWTAPAGTTPYTAYRVVRTNSTGGTASFVVSGTMNPLNGTITAPGTSFADASAVSAGGTYFYTVYAMNGPKVAATGAATAPVAVTQALSSAAATVNLNDPTQLTVNWTVSGAGTGVTAFQLTRTPTFGAATTVTVAASALSNGVYSYVDATAAPLTSYTYTVKAMVGAAVGSTLTTAPVTTGPAILTAPGALAAAFTAPTTVNLTWVDTAKGETGYKVERAAVTIAANGTTTTSPYSTLVNGTPANLASYTDTAPAANTTYVYRVTPVYQGTTGLSSSVAVNTGALATVTAVRANNAPTDTSIGVRWTIATPLAGTTGLQLQFSADGGTNWSNSGAVLAANATNATVTGLVNNSPYLFRVVSLNSLTGTTNVSAVSAAITTASIATGKPTLSATTGTTVTLTWTASAYPADVASLTVQQSTSPTGPFTDVQAANLTLAANGLGATVTGLSATTTVYFSVLAKGTGAVGNASSAVSNAFNAVPATPTGVTAVNGAQRAPITGGLRWNAVTGATSYIVSWTVPGTTTTGSVTVNASAATTATTGQLPFTTTGNYPMTVTAVLGANASAPSAPVYVTVQ